MLGLAGSSDLVWSTSSLHPGSCFSSPSTWEAVKSLPCGAPYERPLPLLLGDLARKEGIWVMALSWQGACVCHHRVIPHWHHRGDVGKHSTAQGQVQIVLKCTNELGSGAAKEFSISAESYSVHFYYRLSEESTTVRGVVKLCF